LEGRKKERKKERERERERERKRKRYQVVPKKFYRNENLVIDTPSDSTFLFRKCL
jgi:hypothetical protein